MLEQPIQIKASLMLHGNQRLEASQEIRVAHRIQTSLLHLRKPENWREL